MSTLKDALHAAGPKGAARHRSGADRRLVALHQPHAQHLLQVHGTPVPIDHRQALGLQLLAQHGLVA